MSAVGLLPRRWREDPACSAHAEAIAHVLDTPPVTAREDGLAIVAELGTTDLLRFLVAAKSLWRQLRRGRFVIAGDRSLTGADRAILAHHLDDPEFAHAPGGEFPPGLPWEAFELAFARRRTEYWLVLSPGLVASGSLADVVMAIAANRSLALGHAPGGLIGLSAGGPGAPDPQDFARALGEQCSAAAQQALLLRREANPVIVPPGESLSHFADEHRFGEDCRAASCAAIAAFG